MTAPCYIFLDIDGVLNSHDWWKRRDEAGNRGPDELMGIYELDPVACRLLQRICDDTGAALVICSTWRKYHTIPVIQDLFRQRGLTAEIVGRTPDLQHHESKFPDMPWSEFGRGLECQWWLQHYLGNEATCSARFVCVDDDSDYGDLLGKLVQTRRATGLTPLETDYIYKHLSEPLMDSMAAGGRGRVLFKYDTLGLAPWWSGHEGPFGPTP